MDEVTKLKRIRNITTSRLADIYFLDEKIYFDDIQHDEISYVDIDPSYCKDRYNLYYGQHPVWKKDVKFLREMFFEHLDTLTIVEP